MRVRTTHLAVLLGCLLAASPPAQGQPATIYRIGYISPESEARGGPTFDAFRSGMQSLGYVEGKTLSIDARWGDGSDEVLDRHAAELIRSKPHLLVSQTRAVFAIRRGATALPVVFAFSGDPVVAKLVESLAHPGGNYTGMSMLSLDLAGKRVELLKELLPGLKRVAIIVNPGHAGEQAERRVSETVAQALGLSLSYFAVRNTAELDLALIEVPKGHCEAILVFPDALTMAFAERIAAFTAKTRIPAMSGWVPFAEQGNLVTYGPELRDAFRRLATYADKILKGANPADLPVELPTKFELAINLKTARAIGLRIPQSVALRVDRVIE